MSSKGRWIDINDEKFKIPLQNGWTREMKERRLNGHKLCDVYYHSPSPQIIRFRTITDIKKHLISTQSDLKSHYFTMSKQLIGASGETVKKKSEPRQSEKKNFKSADSPKPPLMLKFPDLVIPKDKERFMRANRQLDRSVQLPCQPNVATLFENYLKYSAKNNFIDNYSTNENGCQSEIITHQQREKRFKICEEVLEGLRKLFNSSMIDLWANEEEEFQYRKSIDQQPPCSNIEHADLSNGESSIIPECEDNKSENELDEFLKKIDSWKAVLDIEYKKKKKQPAIICGARHLLWFLVNLPRIVDKCIKSSAKCTSDCVIDAKLKNMNSICNGLLRPVLHFDPGYDFEVKYRQESRTWLLCTMGIFRSSDQILLVGVLIYKETINHFFNNTIAAKYDNKIKTNSRHFLHTHKEYLIRGLKNAHDAKYLLDQTHLFDV